MELANFLLKNGAPVKLLKDCKLEKLAWDTLLCEEQKGENHPLWFHWLARTLLECPDESEEAWCWLMETMDAEKLCTIPSDIFLENVNSLFVLKEYVRLLPKERLEQMGKGFQEILKKAGANQVVKVLLERGVSPNMRIKSDAYWTRLEENPLFFFSTTPEVLDVFIKNGIDYTNGVRNNTLEAFSKKAHRSKRKEDAQMLEMIKADIFEKSLPSEKVSCALDFLKEAKLQKEINNVFVMLRKQKINWRTHREANGATFLHMLGLIDCMDLNKLMELTKCKIEDLEVQDKNGLTVKDYFLLGKWPELILSGGAPVEFVSGGASDATSTLLLEVNEKEKIRKINKTICELGEERWLSFSFFSWSSVIERQEDCWGLFFSAVSKAEKITKNSRINRPDDIDEFEGAFTTKVANEKTASVFFSGLTAAIGSDLSEDDDDELSFWDGNQEEYYRVILNRGLLKVPNLSVDWIKEKEELAKSDKILAVTLSLVKPLLEKATLMQSFQPITSSKKRSAL
jgi:hypothetical protein